MENYYRYIYPQENGVIQLDSGFVSKSVEKFTQISVKGKKELRELYQENPRGNNLIPRLRAVRSNELVWSVLYWLNHISLNVDKIIQKIVDNDLDFRQLQKNWFSYLYDVSYRMYFGGDNREYINNVCNKEINIKKSVLAHISWYPQNRYGLEYIGLLTGKRNSDGSIKEITNFIPIKSGRDSRVIIRSGEFTEACFSLKAWDKSFVGWYHSHPRYYPIYSNKDKGTHLFSCYAFSIYRAMKLAKERYNSIHVVSELVDFNFQNLLFLLKAAEAGFSIKQFRLDFRYLIAQYILDCQRKTGYITTYKNTLTNQEIESSYVQYNSLVNENFPMLKRRIERMLRRRKIGLAPEIKNLELLPTCGLVICPESRYIAAIDCSKDTKLSRDLSNGWYYYRINPSC